jgi:hypothetical protein
MALGTYAFCLLHCRDQLLWQVSKAAHRFLRKTSGILHALQLVHAHLLLPTSLLVTAAGYGS